MKFLGFEKFLCSRCLGILLGGIIGASLHFLGYHFIFIISTIFAIPLLIDGFSQYFGFRESNNTLRLITGILFGISLNYVGVLI